MGGWHISPFMDWVYFRKTFSGQILSDDGSVLLHLSDGYAEGPAAEPAWNELIGFGPLCKYFRPEDLGGKCLLPIMCNDMYRLGDMMEDDGGELIANEDWAIKEETLMAFAPFICLSQE